MRETTPLQAKYSPADEHASGSAERIADGPFVTLLLDRHEPQDAQRASQGLATIIQEHTQRNPAGIVRVYIEQADRTQESASRLSQSISGGMSPSEAYAEEEYYRTYGFYPSHRQDRRYLSVVEQIRDNPNITQLLLRSTTIASTLCRYNESIL